MIASQGAMMSMLYNISSLSTGPVLMIPRKHFRKYSARDCHDHLNHGIQLFVLFGNCVQESCPLGSWDCTCFGIFITPGRPHPAGHVRGHAICEQQGGHLERPPLMEKSFQEQGNPCRTERSTPQEGLNKVIPCCMRQVLHSFEL